MDIKNIYHIAQRAMGAQLVRLNATASNLANADNIASPPIKKDFQSIHRIQI